MRRTFLFLLMLASSVPAGAQQQAGVTSSALIAAARQAPVRLIDYGEERCDGDTTVEAWLTTAVRR